MYEIEQFIMGDGRHCVAENGLVLIGAALGVLAVGWIINYSVSYKREP